MEALRKTYMNDAVPKKQSTKISPWALARLNPEDALRASAEARKKSSVLRPIVRKGGAASIVIPETDISGEYSSGEMIKDLILPLPPRIETRSRFDNVLLASKIKNTRSLHTDMNPPLLNSGTKSSLSNGRSSVDETKKLSADCSSGSAKIAVCLTPLQLEARNAFCQNDQTLLESSSSSLTTPNEGSPDAQISCESPEGSNISSSASHHNDYKNTDSAAVTPIATLVRSTSDGYEASGGESADDNDRHIVYHFRTLQNSYGIDQSQYSPSMMINQSLIESNIDTS